jgi:hypothetical protein
MRIVRLSTENRNAIFDNNFNTDIILKPYSKVALQNLSLETEKESLVIGPDETFQFAIGRGNIKTGEYIPQTYTHNNSSLLLADLQDTLNNLVGNQTQEIGIEWRVDTNAQNKVRIEYKKGLDQEHFNKLTTDNGSVAVDVSGSSPSNIFTSGITDPSGTLTNSCYMTLNDYYLALGAGRTSLKINNLKVDNGAGINRQGFMFGLTTINPSTITQGDNFPLSEIDYGVWCSNLMDNYRAIELGVPRGTNLVSLLPHVAGVGDVNNDSIEIIRNNGKLQIYVHSFIYGTNLIDEIDDVVNTEYYVVIAFRGYENDVGIRQLRTTLSPYQSEPTTEIKSTELFNVEPPPQDTDAQEHFFDFGTISVANFLGFNNQRNPRVDYDRATKNYKLIANREYEPIDVADSFIVEMLGNISLSSYDGLKSVRKSILAVIPESDNNANGSVIFDAKEKVFVDINNANPLTLRNVKTRVVKNDYTEMSIKGEATMTLIFKDENE